MKYYKLDNQVFAFESDGSQDEFITDQMVLMTDNEVLFHQNNDGTLTYDAETDSIIVDDALVAAKKEREQLQVWENIKSLRQDKMTGGVYVLSVDKYLHTDETSSIQYAQIGTAISLGMFQPMNWKTMEGDFIELTEAIFRELQIEMIVNTQSVYARAEYHKYMMMQSDNPLDYDYSTGWAT
ncbi:DUF4376 domain-containing protein [Psychrobacter sp. SZ93C1]|uniref:DUF4376 domain-containing protein n=1 Tax=Psychrobacter sp. SZ93C1 TaxID=2792058 RepID=UPI0018CDE5C8|nr:DUF4376 domain-containing protein [Psychrobacter sp. SZ93C1]MBH0065134.1 DUF4376 domain-containing protein [Psychrobacter sp. SZ93C1]